jgi:DNA invertase Pin-like site-specific DNA recombinase
VLAVYGYVRVSTREQKEDRQIDSMLEQGIDEENIFFTIFAEGVT